jgi:hypothetical protein
MDIDKVADIIDEVLKGLMDEKIYPYSAKRQFGMGNKVATGSLKASIMVVPTSRKGMVVFELFANDYFQWVQSGRAAGKKGVPIDAILQWMGARGIMATDTSNVKYKALQSQVSTAYIINKSRMKKGKKPLPMKVLLDWIKEKNVKFNIDLQRGMAFAIQRNIKEFGILPSNIEDKLYDRLESSPVFINALEQYTFQQFENMVDNIFISTKIETT